MGSFSSPFITVKKKDEAKKAATELFSRETKKDKKKKPAYIGPPKKEDAKAVAFQLFSSTAKAPVEPVLSPKTSTSSILEKKPTSKKMEFRVGEGITQNTTDVLPGPRISTVRAAERGEDINVTPTPSRTSQVSAANMAVGIDPVRLFEKKKADERKAAADKLFSSSMKTPTDPALVPRPSSVSVEPTIPIGERDEKLLPRERGIVESVAPIASRFSGEAKAHLKEGHPIQAGMDKALSYIFGPVEGALALSMVRPAARWGTGILASATGEKEKMYPQGGAEELLYGPDAITPTKELSKTMMARGEEILPGGLGSGIGLGLLAIGGIADIGAEGPKKIGKEALGKIIEKKVAEGMTREAAEKLAREEVMRLSGKMDLLKRETKAQLESLKSPSVDIENGFQAWKKSVSRNPDIAGLDAEGLMSRMTKKGASGEATEMKYFSGLAGGKQTHDELLDEFRKRLDDEKKIISKTIRSIEKDVPTDEMSSEEFQSLQREYQPKLSSTKPIIEPVKGEKVKGFVRTVKESQVASPEVKASISGSYTPITNVRTLQDAEALLDNNFEGTRSAIKERLLDPDKIFEASHTTTAEALMVRLRNLGNFEEEQVVGELLAEKLLKQGQGTQAAAIYGNMSPEGVLINVRKIVKKANEGGLRAKSLARQISLTPEVEKEIVAKAKTNQAYAAAIDRFKAKISTVKPGNNQEILSALDILKTEIKKVGLDDVNSSSIDSIQTRLIDNINAEIKRVGLGDVNPSSVTAHQVFLNGLEGAKRTSMERLKDAIQGAVPATVLDQLSNLPRAMMATADLSAPLRQGLFLIGRPKNFAKAFVEMMKVFSSKAAYEDLMFSIRSRPTYSMMIDSGLSLSDMGTDLTKREEMFRSNWSERIWGFGKLSRASNRAYSGFLNKLRADTFDDLVRGADKLGVLRERPNAINDIAEYVNTATGRGSIGIAGIGKLTTNRGKNAAPILNAVFFSPRLMASRLSLLNPAYYAKLDPFVRKEALKNLGAFGAVTGSVLGLAKLGGAEVSMDPANADFLKIKVGNTRYDILGGFQQYLVYAYRMSTKRMVSSTTGKEFRLGEGYKPVTRGGITWNLLKNKLSPIGSFVAGLLEGESGGGEPLDMYAETLDRFIPMVFSDIYDKTKGKGVAGLPSAIPGIFGVGSQTYGDKIPMESRTAKGKPTLKWMQEPGLAGDIVNKFRGIEIKPTAVKETYDKVQALKKTDMDAAQSIVDGLSDEEYAIYKKFVERDKAIRKDEMKIKMKPVYAKSRELKKAGKLDELKELVEGMTDEEYAAYKDIKDLDWQNIQ